VKLAVEILEPLLRDSLDPTCDVDRTIGCCYLRMGDVGKAETHLNRGIDWLSTSSQLKSLDLLFAEIEQEAVDWRNRGPVLDLLQRARARIEIARKHFEAPPSVQTELHRFIDWGQARVQTEEWSWIGANAGLARVELDADELERAEAIYRVLGQDGWRFTEAGLGLAKVALRYRELGEETLRKGWQQPAACGAAVTLFERALALDQSVSTSDRGELLVRLALAQFQAGATQKASTTFADAATVLEASGRADPGAILGDACLELIAGVSCYWALDAYLRELSHEQATPEPLRSAIPRTIERLGDYLGTAVERTGAHEEARMPTVIPIALEISGNLAPQDGQEKEWPLLKRFIPEMRQRIDDEIVIIVPGVEIQCKPYLRDDNYVIRLDDVPIAEGRVSSRGSYRPAAASALEAAGIPVAELKEANHPLSKQPGLC
jgi:hypothetical protein